MKHFVKKLVHLAAISDRSRLHTVTYQLQRWCHVGRADSKHLLHLCRAAAKGYGLWPQTFVIITPKMGSMECRLACHSQRYSGMIKRREFVFSHPRVLALIHQLQPSLAKQSAAGASDDQTGDMPGDIREAHVCIQVQAATQRFKI